MESIIINEKNDEPLYIQIYSYYKEEIIKGRLGKNTKLPSIRQLSMDLKVSKTTVEGAYNQLVVEGYIDNIPKKGYFVVDLNEEYFSDNSSRHIQKNNENTITYLNIGVDKNSFDIKTWRKLYGNVLKEPGNHIFTSGHEQGEIALRKNICSFINKTRGVECIPSQIVIGGGVSMLLGILCSILKGDKSFAALEFPGFIQAKNVFENYGYDTVSIPVNEDGIDIKELKKSNAEIAYISPSHQYPMGSIMPINKRIEILNWAKEQHAFIVEDDYDCLLRYETRPIPALQGLDNGKHVIYLGSFSKLLLPSIRISYMVLPQLLMDKYLKGIYTQSSSKLEQLTLAGFMEMGHFEKHLRKIKKIYKKKNELITNFINSYKNNNIRIIGNDSGLHMMLEVNSTKSIEDIINKAREFNIYLETVEGYNKDRLLILLTYSGIDEEEIEQVLTNLVRCI